MGTSRKERWRGSRTRPQGEVYISYGGSTMGWQTRKPDPASYAKNSDPSGPRKLQGGAYMQIKTCVGRGRAPWRFRGALFTILPDGVVCFQIDDDFRWGALGKCFFLKN